jgi:ADP-heptose:LPS heptosyltransferase
MDGKPRNFILHFNMAPGDVSMLTSLVRDIKLTYGDQYQVDVRTNFPALWRHNPYLRPMSEDSPDVENLYLRKECYLAALSRAQRGERIHFVRAFHQTFETQTGIHVPLHYPRPDLHLSDEEKQVPLIAGRYWIVVPGGKLDMTNKIWLQDRWQAVVDQLRPWGLRFVQEGATKPGCTHPPLNNVLNTVGLTSVRDLLRNIWHADGVICNVTFMMHVAAAMERPCVVLGGGREEPWWEEYSNDWQAFGEQCAPVRVPHRFLHTLGQLSCCQTKGCWFRRVVPLSDNHTEFNKSLCRFPDQQFGQVVPRCLTHLQVEHVTEAVMWYYEHGFLPPPQQQKTVA